MAEQSYTMPEAMLYSQRMAQLSKALWKAVEKDWQHWIKPFGLNINEHHILWIAAHLKGATISEVAKFGVMHVSTAFNFSKKLEERGYLSFSKREDDKRSTYVEVTGQGSKLLLEINNHYFDTEHSVLTGSLPVRQLYGRFPEFIELMAVIRNIYGDDFMDIFEQGFRNMDRLYGQEDNGPSQGAVGALAGEAEELSREEKDGVS
ncbi:MarR family transcriptional regulator, protease production regulatory protein HPr [Bhargavaea beijingensis]|uniref:MarR family transcriptional regulator, protease production regulatory protein HPr n=1 Tax=Bhargavaea beijingensis TaxID=426756 RepID=A0A1G7E1Q7_9BACL|nr:HTH-type transcriptional regulator Hpr [Bhargavaea beijingensis]MCW1927471.1 HTH-type transcriptional regulator Hpr [Bhargavaea beijingensis]SDE57638.1 MarR family transcriptional regulator, protease production regulatory protein HPr [Bhargavaea beijingensis]